MPITLSLVDSVCIDAADAAEISVPNEVNKSAELNTPIVNKRLADLVAIAVSFIFVGFFMIKLLWSNYSDIGNKNPRVKQKG
jgi:hypothetical protein